MISALLILGGSGSNTALAKSNSKTYVVKQGDTPYGVAKRHGVTLDELYRFNGIIPGGSFTVGMKLEIPGKGQVSGSTYTVRSGDSVASVSDFYGVSQDDLRALNHMGPKGELKAGDTIEIPRRLRNGMKGHVVRKGDTLGSIAKKYGVKVRNLMAANKLKSAKSLQLGRTLVIPEEDDAGQYQPKKTDKLLKTGEKVPGGVRHTVQAGQTLWTIARAYHISKERIAKRNGISVKEPLREGQKILVPGAKKVVPVRVKGFTIQPITFVRVHNNETMTLRLMTQNGQVSAWARKKLSQLAGPKMKGVRNKRLHPRLIHMIQRVAERYPGQVIEIVSGYRPGESGNESMHSLARALDFRVRGVPNRELYEFCIGLPNAGCGYYPNSVFIHMDARQKSATWTDYSGPGEKAQYQKPDEPEKAPSEEAQQ
ncbi:MAG: LysM peptidoglycan-binding domain-containing protein [Deltaproteobacteria bacterium]|nr:LysM peptidoglycan-binding domain-containing protein [Deltaproteobacteria bacterium]MBN2670634.1 LysM peptidoglycan-binding domain-containing protein [Deltaproteobacteria bacterium]